MASWFCLAWLSFTEGLLCSEEETEGSGYMGVMEGGREVEGGETVVGSIM